MMSLSGEMAELAVLCESCPAVVEMAAKLINGTGEEKQSVVWFLWAGCEPKPQIHLCVVWKVDPGLVTKPRENYVN